MGLIKFLQKEVQAEQCLAMAVNGFLITPTKNDDYKKIEPPENEDILSATGLHTR